MRKIILLLLIAATAHAQKFDDVMRRYEKDSAFLIITDSTFHDFVAIEDYSVFEDTYTFIYQDYVKDYGTQPYELLHQRDSLAYNIGDQNGLDTAVFHLDAVIGKTKSAAAFFVLKGTGAQRQKSISINNENSNDYDAYIKYGWKFLFWRAADKFKLTIK